MTSRFARPGCSNRSDKDPGKRLKALFTISRLKTKSLKKVAGPAPRDARFIVYIHFIAVTNSYRFCIGEGKTICFNCRSLLSQFLAPPDLSISLKFFVCSDTRDTSGHRQKVKFNYKQSK